MPVDNPTLLTQAPAATVPLACSCDELQRAQRRLEALASRCNERIERLSQAFDQLPAAASVDPFALAAPAAGQAGSEVDARTVRRHRNAQPSVQGSRAAASAGPLQAADRAAATPLPDGGSQAAAGAHVGKPGSGTGKVDKSGVAALNDWLGSLGQLAALGGEQVTLLMQRHAAPPPVIGLEAALAAARAPGRKIAQPAAAAQRRQTAGFFDAGLGAAVSKATQALAGASDPVAAFSPGLAQAMAEAAAGSTIQPPSPARPGGAQSSGLVSAAQLLGQLLSQGVGSVVADSFGGSTLRAVPSRQAAPRAVSRLVGPLPTVQQGKARAPAPDAPAADALESPDTGEALAQQINRLLLDQAWLRGVDLK